ncbi:MAG: hypothetical protein HKL85_03125 [Acidimicrobiaceae bacterium]|nr:hypothetical protein [Acidimicrobiaceae bacterium]
MRPVTLFIANAGGTLDDLVNAVNDAFQTSVKSAQLLLGVEGVDVLVIDAPELAIPEWGVGGYTYGPHVIVVALDPAVTVSCHRIERTLVHEFHHTMRWRGPGCEGSLGQMLVSEGMAQLFEEEVLGDAPFFSRVTITDEEIAAARAVMYEPELSQTKWFFGADSIALHFGYTYGYRICKAYADITGKRASELIGVPSREILELERR